MTGKTTGSGKGGKRRSATSAAARWFFDNSLDMFAVVNREGIFVEVNDAWERLTGWSREDLVGRSVYDLIHEDSYEELRDSRRRMKQDGHTVNQLCLRCKDGRWMWIQGRSRIDPSGAMIGTLQDITEAVKQKEELETARKIQSMLAEAAGIGTWLYEPRNNTIEWSPDLHALSGWSPEELLDPESFYALLDPSEVESVRALFRAGVEEGQAGSAEHRMRTKDGRWLTMRATFRTIQRGRYFSLRGISQDVTALVAARDAARAGEALVKALMDEAVNDGWRRELALRAAQAGPYEIDHVARKFWASEQFSALIGRQIDYESMASIGDFIHPEDRPIIAAADARWTVGEKNVSPEFRIVRPDGEIRWVQVFYELDTNARKGVGLLIDIDARKRQELALIEAQRAAESAAEAKARFLANMSHEIRTPMNGVLGVLHLLRGEAMSDDGRRLLAEALSCGEMLSALLDDVIDFERIEAGRLDLSFKPVDAGDLLRGVVRMLEPHAREKGLALELRLDGEPGWVLADPVRLRQCLFNLIGNAVKFTLRGRVTVRCDRPSPDRLRFQVIDTGVGIPFEAQGRLFERFHQADASTTRRFGGSGLGLAITRTLARMMQGDVTFDSAPGRGSIFRLEVAAPAAEAVQTAEEVGGLALEGLSVLVVEDNATNRTIARKMLESLGARVHAAEDGLAGVEAAANGAFDLILMDIQMPGIDGMEAARRIRALSGPCARTPIIALTANVLAHQREIYLAAGMDGVVGKPISPGALLGEIARLAAMDGDATAVA